MAGAKFFITAFDKTGAAFKSIEGRFSRLSKKIGGMTKSVGGLSGLIATAFAARGAVGVITKFEKLEASLRTITGSAENAAIAFEFIEKFAATTPFQLEEVVDAFIKLKALGLTPSEGALTSYGNTASAMGKSLNQMIEAVADATTGEFERLKEFGIKSKSQGDQVVFTFQGVSTTVGKNAKEIEGYLQSIGNVQFAGAMKEQASTLNVALSNMSDAFSKLVKEIGDAGLTDLLIFIADKVKWLAESVNNSLTKLGFKGIITSLEIFANSFLSILAGIGHAVLEFGHTINRRLLAVGKDLARFALDPFGGLSFDNTSAALEDTFADAMTRGYNKARDVARKKNAELSAELFEYWQKNVKEKEGGRSLESLFEPALGLGESGGGSGSAGGKSGKGKPAKEKLKETVKGSLSEWDEDVQHTMTRIEDAFGDGITNIITDFDTMRDTVRGTLKDIGNMLLNNQIKQIFAGLTGTQTGGGLAFSARNMLGDVLGYDGRMDGKGVPRAGGSLFGALGDMFGGFFADGGHFAGGKPIVVGERGPELIMPRTSGTVIPNHALMGSGGVTITMNISTPDVGSFRRSQAQIATEMASAMAVAQRRNM